MTRRILVATHGGVAQELAAIAQELLGTMPSLESVSVSSGDSLETLTAKMSKWAARVPAGQRGLVLTDLRNSSATVAALALTKKHAIDCISGVNLPMLLKALSPSEASLEDIVSVGRTGVEVVSRGSKK